MGSFRLDVRNLTVSIGAVNKINILDNVSLSFSSGELIGVLGPSGSGKSTLLNAICGFRKADKGTIIINNMDLYKNLESIRPLIGLVPQDDIIHRDLSVYKTLKYSAQLRLKPGTGNAVIENKVKSLLEMLELTERKATKIKKLSGGQRKRVSIGIELLTGPRIMFLDEPTSGLDPALEEKLMKILRQQADENRLILVSTHILKSLDVLDLVLVMFKGKLVFYGPPAELSRYFEVKEASDIFHKLTKKSPFEWQKLFTGSALFKQYISQRLAETFPSSTFGHIEGETLSEVVVKDIPAPTEKANNKLTPEAIQVELELLKKELGKLNSPEE